MTVEERIKAEPLEGIIAFLAIPPDAPSTLTIVFSIDKPPIFSFFPHVHEFHLQVMALFWQSTHVSDEK